jgi:hypothetical protein
MAAAIGFELLPVDIDRPPFSDFQSSAWGTILQQPVRCLSAAAQRRLHTVYEIREEDTADLAHLCARFGLLSVRLASCG